MDRHLNGDIHNMAVSFKTRENGPKTVGKPSQKRPPLTIQSFIKASAWQDYKKLLQTTWNLVCTPSIPDSHFNILVKRWRENNVCLIDGKDNRKAVMSYNVF